MDMPEAVRNTVGTLEGSAHLTKIYGGDVAWFLVFFLLGSLVILHPFFALGLFAVAATIGLSLLVLVHVRRADLELWQVLLLISLTGYIILNYGFENVAIHVGGFPIIVSYGLMYTSLALAVSSCRHLILSALKEPAMVCLLALLLLSFLHLVVDIPSYGLWAVRDSTICLDGLFFLLGLLWTMRRNSTIPLMKWLIWVFVLNCVYELSFPWGEKLQEWSPESGIFLHVPILGFYHSTYIFSLTGALFCIFLAGNVIRWPRWILFLLAMAQLFGLAIQQNRSMYVGIVTVLILLVLLGETGKSWKLLMVLSSMLMVLFLLTAVAGVELSGRIGPVNFAFFKEHIRSISGAEGTPGSNVQSRFDWADEAFRHFYAHPLIGDGFGQPLVNYVDADNGALVRQPHNSNVTVLARLGAIGFAIWVIFHFCLVKRFIHAYRRRRYCDEMLFELVLWLFMFYVIFMIVTSVEPGLEFPSGAIPFYFFVGLAVGLTRWQIPQRNRERPMAAFVSSVERTRL
jgi:O-antigen ligase